MLHFTDEEIFETLSALRGLPKNEIKQEYSNKPEKLKKLRRSYSRLFSDLYTFSFGAQSALSNSTAIDSI